MNELCGCCAGVEQVTPVANANRPGLSALAYRVGTHATFLETMLARLANHYLEIPPNETKPPQRAFPLHGLTTRDSQDASIAFLDAWATVADVLTFYQERIANEGYLRTSTERRSVLELARLLGYQPRPGVSASVYLAYTLDKDSEVTIPAGSRTQSVPGPGELPQTFETAEDLYTRAEWSLLQPRLTRPQALRVQDLLRKNYLYLKGTATNLKANDPLLIEFGRVALFRVMKVEPDQAADRTKITLRPWAFVPGPVTIPPVVAPGTHVSQVQEIIERHSHAEDFGVNANTQTAQRVLEHLDQLKSKLSSGMTDAQLRQSLEEALPPLREEHEWAIDGNFTKLEPWIGSAVSELEQVSQSLVDRPPNTQPTTQSSLSSLSALLDDLEKPPTIQPSSRQQLGNGLTDTFSASSDALPQLLAAFNPALSSSLYRAWENVSISPPTSVLVYALRARASVFGHNAPLKAITNDSGQITGHEEWTLFRSEGHAATDHFRIGIRFSQSDGEIPQDLITTDIDITTSATTAHATATRSLSNQTYPLNLPAANNEVVTVTISNISANGGLRLTLDFQFQVRRINVHADRNGRGGWTVTSTGSDPTAVAVIDRTANTVTIDGDVPSTAGRVPTEEANKVSLDASYPQILPGSWVVLERPSPLPPSLSPLVIKKVSNASEGTRADYGITAKGTQLLLNDPLNDPWIAPNNDDFSVIRRTSVFAQSELLELAEEPLDPVAEHLCGTRIELANLVSGLEPGRWMIVSGERTDIKQETPDASPPIIKRRIHNAGSTDGGDAQPEDMGATGAALDSAGGGSFSAAAEEAPAAEQTVPGVRIAELVMLSGIEQGYDPRVPGDKTHTTLLLARPLAYCYKLDTIRVYGNVIRATHGETRVEVLGSGDASKAMQSFTLHQSPLTFLSAPTPSGAASTLQVRANDILWHETGSLARLGPKDRNYVIKIDDDDKTTVTFGNGRAGARLPSGEENVNATYRTGIGQPGNVKAEQISVVTTKPLGVKEVVNPLPATGGADREGRDEARRNAPLAVMALDRLVSTQDYEDFARTFAGIGKASAVRLSDGRRQLVHLTIAGADDIPISTDSDLYRNLREALRKYGDPFQPFQVALRFLKVLFVSANVRVQPDYIWESVEPKIRAALLDRFSFNRRELGQDVVLSEVIGTIQSVAGVLYVDVDTLTAVEENASTERLLKLSTKFTLKQRIRAHLAQVDITALDPAARIRPAQLAIMTPLVSGTLNLTELK